ncbi:MAG TPA: hypothetical protein VGM73_05660, partial [Candidatus Didemnitutus sp.]
MDNFRPPRNGSATQLRPALGRGIAALSCVIGLAAGVAVRADLPDFDLGVPSPNRHLTVDFEVNASGMPEY